MDKEQIEIAKLLGRLIHRDSLNLIDVGEAFLLTGEILEREGVMDLVDKLRAEKLKGK